MTQPRNESLIRCLKSYSGNYGYVFTDPIFCDMKDYSLYYLKNLNESKINNIFEGFLESSRGELKKYEKEINQYLNTYVDKLNKYYSNEKTDIQIGDNGNIGIIPITKDLAVCLAPYTSESSNDDTAHYIKEGGVIFVYALIPGFSFSQQKWVAINNAVLDTLSHEFSHYIDYINNKKFEDNEPGTSEYYNNTRERTAYINKLIRILERKLVNKLYKKDFKSIKDVEKQEFITEFLNNILSNCQNDVELKEFVPFISKLTSNNLRKLYEDLTRRFIAKYFESYHTLLFKPNEKLLKEMKEDIN